MDPIAAQRVLNTWTALQRGILPVIPDYQALANEIKNAQLTVSGLVNTRGLSEAAISFAITVGAGLAKEVEIDSSEKPSVELQSRLFELFHKAFAVLTGRAVELITTEEEIRDRMVQLVQEQHQRFFDAMQTVLDELREFYAHHDAHLFNQAKRVGGMRLVTGGQRQFGPSALSAVQLTALYADTQLIPDPIYPFVSADLHLNALPLQLAIELYHILKLRPLVDAELPIPPILLFPSFEQILEEHDVETKLGFGRLAVRMVGPICEGKIESLEDLFDYATIRGDKLADAILEARLFVPPHGDPGVRLTKDDAIEQYLSAVTGIRSSEIVSKMGSLSASQLLLTGVLERLRPHYHLLENVNELGAQPLLSTPVHWHYFEMCASANAKELVRREVLSDQSFKTLRAIQDDSLSWLANISVEDLATLIANNENQWLRSELDGYTKQLAAAGSIDTNEMVREVSFGLSALVQRHQKAIKEIEGKYAPKKLSVAVGGLAGLGVAATVAMLPSLSPLIGVGLPGAAAVAATGVAALGYGRAKIGELAEKRQVDRSMLGVLAMVRPKS